MTLIYKTVYASNRTQIRPVFECFGGHFVFTIQNPDRTFLTASLDRFIQKNNLFMTLFY